MSGRCFNLEMDLSWDLETYRTTSEGSLKIHFPAVPCALPHADLVFVHGGGWNAGSPAKLYDLCEHLSKHGIRTFLPEYRLLKDTREGIRAPIADIAMAWEWVCRFLAEESGKSARPLYLGGGSAGAHLALMAWRRHPDSFSASAAPAGWILGNPVIDTSGDGFGRDLLGDAWQDYSPRHHIHSLPAPVLYLQGSADQVTRLEIAREWIEQLRANHTRVELVIKEGAEHAFFNLPPNRAETARAIRDFVLGQPL
jgi:acetyl esterase/lipase